MATTRTALCALLRLNHRLWLRCLADVSDELLLKRPSPTTNNLAFLALHVLDARYFLAAHLGSDRVNPYQERFDAIRSVEDLTPETLPPTGELKHLWRELAPALESRLAEIPQEQLAAPSTQSFPVEDPSLLGGVAFLLQHESFHIGQMALLRKLWGLPAMSYRPEP